jgi:hypothetical protein
VIKSSTDNRKGERGDINNERRATENKINRGRESNKDDIKSREREMTYFEGERVNNKSVRTVK